MIEVPERFRCKMPFDYPPGNRIIFEEWFYMMYDDVKDEITDREYLPIFFTSFQVSANFGRNKFMMKDLQDFVNSLDRSKKYYTIVQYDDGIIVDVSHLDIKVFAMSGQRVDYCLPLIAEKLRFDFSRVADNKRYFASFIGRDTHKMRSRMIHSLITSQKQDLYISTAKHQIEDYCRIMYHSVFTLCPRGFGQTSFRISEAIQYGSIPVYISDEFLIPHGWDFEQYGVLISESMVDNIYNILKSIPVVDVINKQANLKHAFNSLYSFEANKKLILQNA